MSKPVEQYIRQSIKKYSVHFPLEFYREIYRLRGMSTDGDSLYHRPGFIGALTNKLIYQRFPALVLPTLQRYNPLLGDGGRRHKHFQYLTEVGEIDLNQFIAEAIETMRGCKHWYQFENRFNKLCGRPYYEENGLFGDLVISDL